MKRFPIFIFVFLIIPVIISAADEGRFMQYPDIQGDKIVFSYEGDLWTVGKSGGLAMRLTSHPGEEYAAKFSPDGKWIAFTGSYDNGRNVYLIPFDGGTPKRLTYRASSQVVAWTPDGKKIIFRSAFENTFRPCCTKGMASSSMITRISGKFSFLWSRNPPSFPKIKSPSEARMDAIN